MELLVLVPSLFLFLYCLHRLAKDDYVLMRKNISVEQVFDIAFIVIWFSLIFSRFLFLVLHPSGNLLVSFFATLTGSFSLIGAIIGGAITLFLICRYKKIPLGRMSDFFTIALLAAMPLGFLSNAFLHKHIELLLSIFSAAIYFLLVLFFTKALHPKLMHRTIKEGNITILFLLAFSLVSFFSSLLVSSKKLALLLDPQTLVLFGLFIFSLILLFKQESGKGRKSS